MNGRAAALALLLLAPAAFADEIVRRFGQLSVAVDTTYAYPGGIAVVRFRPQQWAASTFAIFEGRRAPVFAAAGGPRALVPIPASNPGGGSGLLGIELYARRGPQRLRMEFPIAARAFAERAQPLNDEKRALLQKPSGLRDGRRLMQAVRTLSSDALWRGPFRPPVAPPPLDSYGGRESASGPPLETMMDGGLGNQHRGLDYPVATGYAVLAPAAGAVVLAEPLLLTGNSVVIDHGQGLVSLLCHLGGPPEVRAGERVDAGARLGIAGDSGIATFSHVHWAVYLFGIAVDPNVVMKLLE
jgi:murein DD-endopeptidase MepM/ murein hydrolase activator NlpD